MIMTKIKLALFIIFCMILAGLFIFAKSDMANTADDFANQSTLMNDNKGVNSKAQFDKQYSYQNSVKVAEDSSSSVNKTAGFNLKGDGQFITDTTVNQYGVPLYDGFTMNQESFDVDYSRFWDNSYKNEHLHGLGDFTNKAARNSVSLEFSSRDPTQKNSKGEYPEGSKYIRSNPTLKEMGGFWTVDGRLCVALPPGAIIAPEKFEPEIDNIWTNTTKYKGKDKGTKRLDYVEGLFSSSILVGQYVDIILADDTVLACICSDTKGLHTGIYDGRDLCNDPLLEGYGHWRGDASTGKLSYVGVVEVCVTPERRKQGNLAEALHISNNKIKGFRVYTGINNLVNGSETEFNNVFTGGN